MDRVITLAPTTPHQQVESSNNNHVPSSSSMGTTAMTPTRLRMRRRPGNHHSNSSSTSNSPVGGGRSNGLMRRLRRSSTGSTNTTTLGSRRRTFDDMAGFLRTDQRTISSSEEQLFPNLFRNRSQANHHNWSDSLLQQQQQQPKQRKQNFQYPSSDPKRSQVVPATGNTMTAHTAMAAAFRESLASVATSLPLSISSPVLDDNYHHHQPSVAASRRMSYSILQEEHHRQHGERLRPQRRLSLSANNMMAAAAAKSSNAGLDRCFQDVMGTACLLPPTTSRDACAAQRVRERLHWNQTTTTTASPKGTATIASGASSNGSIPETSTVSSIPAGRERKALVIDDSLVIRKTVARALTKLGIDTVVQACDGVEGVQRMKEHSFEITLCDFSMPNLGGIHCVQQYRRWEVQQAPTTCTESSLRPKQYIVGMSAHASPGDIAQGIKVGMNEYQPKPLTIKKLGELLESPPVRATCLQLDVWEQGDQPRSPTPSPTTTMRTATSMSSNSSNPLGHNKGGLFADFTTATMLDAMSSSGRSVGSHHVPPQADVLKKAKTEGLFSMMAN